MKKKEFKVLLMDFNRKKYEAYDVLPYFRNIWRGHRFNWEDSRKDQGAAERMDY